MSKKNPKAKKQVNPFERLDKKITGQKYFGNIKETTVSFTAKNGKNDINKHEVEAMLKSITSTGEMRGAKIKTLVRGMNCQRMFTLKTLDGDLLIKDFDDYYENGNRVKNPDKFEKFSEINVTILVYGPQVTKEFFKPKK